MGIEDCRIIELPKIQDVRGNLTYVQSHDQVPFDIKRVYYIYDVPGGSERGSHAHKNLHQFIIAMSGSFDVVLDDGVHEPKSFHLARSYYGLYVCPMMWRTLNNFSSGSVCMAIASAPYDEDEYYRDYDQFRRIVAGP
jgi:dTDP-4-dehydrorhamnose 3,5-epimerase-like enzyme